MVFVNVQILVIVGAVVLIICKYIAYRLENAYSRP